MKLNTVGFFLLLLLTIGGPSWAKQYPVFDGQIYNGLFYPRIDILEWGEPLHLEFQVYDKKRIVHVGGETIKSGGQNIFIASIEIEERGELLCRRVIAPPDFAPGQKLYFYKESDDERDVNIISAFPLQNKTPYSPKHKGPCKDVEAFADKKQNKAPSTTPESNDKKQRSVSSESSQQNGSSTITIEPKKPTETNKLPLNPEQSKAPVDQIDFEFESISNDFNWFN